MNMILQLIASIAYLIFAATVINLLRSGFFGQVLGDTIKIRWFFGPLIALVCLPVIRWEVSLCLGAGAFLWSIFPWSRWYTLGLLPREHGGEPDLTERIIEKIAGDSDGLCMIIRMIFFIPGTIAASIITGNYWTLVASPWLALAMVYSYYFGFRMPAWGEGDMRGHNMDVLVGLVWGVLLSLYI